MGAYLWIDEGTFKFLESQDKIRNLKILYNMEGPLTLNVYSIIASKNEACKGLKDLILKFQDHVMGPGQTLIEEKYARIGLFYAAKGKEGELKKVWDSLAKLNG